MCAIKKMVPLAVFGLAIVLAGTRAQGQVLEVVDGSPDFGTLDLASLEQPELTFTLRNQGPLDTRILNIVAGCGCISVVWLQPVDLPPGETVEVRARLDPLRAAPGRNLFALQAATPTGVQDIGEIGYTYTPIIEVRPRILWLPQGERNGIPGAGTGRARLVLSDAVLLENVGATSDDPHLSTRVVPVAGSKMHAELEVQPLPDHPPGAVDATISIEHGQGSPPVMLRVRGAVSPPVRVVPSVVLAVDPATSLRTVSSERSVEKRVDNDAIDLSKVRLECDSTLVTARRLRATDEVVTFELVMDARREGLHDYEVLIHLDKSPPFPLRVVWRGRGS